MKLFQRLTVIEGEIVEARAVVSVVTVTDKWRVKHAWVMRLDLPFIADWRSQPSLNFCTYHWYTGWWTLLIDFRWWRHRGWKCHAWYQPTSTCERTAESDLFNRGLEYP